MPELLGFVTQPCMLIMFIKPPFSVYWLSLVLLVAAGAQFPGSRTKQQLLTDPQRDRSTPAAASLDFSSSSPHIFSSLRSLLQQWPNTFFPNGHSVVPCEIPPFTSLYHGRRDDQLPPDPEWFAFDIEMSYGIMGSSQSSHMLTVRLQSHCLNDYTNESDMNSIRQSIR